MTTKEGLPQLSGDVKVKVLKRALYLCENCKEYNPILTFHHIIPKRLANNIANINNPENIKALCTRCHKSAHDKDRFFTLEEVEWILSKLKGKDAPIDPLAKEDAVRKLHMLKHQLTKLSKRGDLLDDLSDTSV
jgi:hypothetical protein